MCGIVGVIGEQEVAPILVKGLKRLEYRGYDSAGIATLVDDKIVITSYSIHYTKLYDPTRFSR